VAEPERRGRGTNSGINHGQLRIWARRHWKDLISQRALGAPRTRVWTSVRQTELDKTPHRPCRARESRAAREHTAHCTHASGLLPHAAASDASSRTSHTPRKLSSSPHALPDYPPHGRDPNLTRRPYRGASLCGTHRVSRAVKITGGGGVEGGTSRRVGCGVGIARRPRLRPAPSAALRRACSAPALTHPLAAQREAHPLLSMCARASRMPPESVRRTPALQRLRDRSPPALAVCPQPHRSPP